MADGEQLEDAHSAGWLVFRKEQDSNSSHPEPLVENTSLNEATDKIVANPTVIEAEQTAIKAHAGLALAKLTYIPTVAILGGYANQNAINDRVLPQRFRLYRVHCHVHPL